MLFVESSVNPTAFPAAYDGKIKEITVRRRLKCLLLPNSAGAPSQIQLQRRFLDVDYCRSYVYTARERRVVTQFTPIGKFKRGD